MCGVDACPDWVGVCVCMCVCVCILSVQRAPQGEEWCPCLTKREVLKRESVKKKAAKASFFSFPVDFRTRALSSAADSPRVYLGKVANHVYRFCISWNNVQEL